MPQVELVVAGWGGLFSGRVRRYNRAFPPLDLLNCAALLRQTGHHVGLSDCRANPQAREGLALRMRRAALTVVSLSPLDRWQCPNTDLDQIDQFLAGLPRERLILSGAQPTLHPQLLLERTGAAGVILGEPESAIVALADGQPPGQAPGTAVVRDGALVLGPKPSLVDLTELPIPAFDLLDPRQYRYEVLGGRLGLLELTRGCPWRCKFCLLAMYGKQYRRKRPAQVVAEANAAWRSGIRCVYFQDLEFTLDPELVTELCHRLIADGPPGLRWACQTRPDTVTRPLLRTLRRAGCEVIHFGVESGVQRVVDITGKHQRLQTVERAVTDASAEGLRTLCFFLIGLPGETPTEMQQTLRFAQRLGPTWASFQVATPYPTTPLHTAGHWHEPFPESFPGPLTADQLRALARRLTMAYHLRPAYLWNRLRRPGRRHALSELALLGAYLRPGR